MLTMLFLDFQMLFCYICRREIMTKEENSSLNNNPTQVELNHLRQKEKELTKALQQSHKTIEELNRKTSQPESSKEKLKPDSINKDDESLADSEKKYRAFFNSIPIGLYRSTPAGKLIEVNNSLVNMLAFPDKKTLLNTSVTELFQDKKERQRETKLLSEVGDVRRYELKLRRYDGQVIWVEDYARVIRDKNAEMRIGATIRNITKTPKIMK